MTVKSFNNKINKLKKKIEKSKNFNLNIVHDEYQNLCVLLDDNFQKDSENYLFLQDKLKKFFDWTLEYEDNHYKKYNKSYSY